MKHKSIFAHFWDLLFEKKPAFNLGVPRARSERPKLMPDEDIKELFQNFHECCDDEDTDLREAIAYSLRLLGGQTNSITAKNPIAALPNFLMTEITQPSELQAGMQPKSKKA
jgi:hypothetical protein